MENEKDILNREKELAERLKRLEEKEKEVKAREKAARQRKKIFDPLTDRLNIFCQRQFERKRKNKSAEKSIDKHIFLCYTD